MTEQETTIVNNIAIKLEFILNKNQITVLALSRLLKMDKQPLYRIIKREHIPNISFLETIANYLNCTVIELIDKKFFFDINAYHNNSIFQKEYEKYRIYYYDENFLSVADNTFFGVIENSTIKVFYKVNKITIDGHYLMQEEDNKFTEVNILSAGSNLIIALINDQEVRLDPKTTIVTAKLYTIVSIIESEGYAIKH